MRLLLATSNRKKVEELKRLIDETDLELLLPEQNIHVEETGCSFLENAYLKAKAYYDVYQIPTLAEDSGLVIPAIDGYPGIFSSRFYQIEYGGREELEKSHDWTNIKKVLRLMKNKEKREAYYYACIFVYSGERGFWSEGRCEGSILHEPRGEGGFGYDPIFRPAGYDSSMAELTPEEKNKISHRGKALRNLLKLLKMLK